jgi:hypothetical protein
MNAMPEERPRGRKTELALATAHGTSVTTWARRLEGTGMPHPARGASHPATPVEAKRSSSPR